MLAAAGGGPAGPPPSVHGLGRENGMRSAAVRISLGALGLATAVLSVASSLQASTVVAPEIDSSALPAVLGMLTAGVLMLRARRRSK
jgi:hypothetical protein